MFESVTNNFYSLIIPPWDEDRAILYSQSYFFDEEDKSSDDSCKKTKLLPKHNNMNEKIRIAAL